MMYGKDESCKINGSISHRSFQYISCFTIISDVFPNGLFLVKLKRDLKYRGHIYFESDLPHIVYEQFTSLKSCNKGEGMIYLKFKGNFIMLQKKMFLTEKK